ncbi:SatD family protein [Nocardioides sp. CFH 31398]|uniref:SatD family protein n=1 Tax=Nocardioides sp. CFH 31398 TaxID=2919579 RepID=UPI001F05A932|nr:SatD family protein [Nocardioides sp. CFH 31398]MCH1867462.1 SatD family protein [Nocardioides sp. CFH 31398]
MDVQPQASSAPAGSGATIAVIADLVASRTSSDRAALHRRVVDVLAEANERFGPATPLRVTVGDEFQGAFASLGQALRTTLWLRMALLVGEPGCDVRFGLGRGDVTVVDAERGIEDGTAWWVARDALTGVEAEAGRAGLRHRRTSYRADPATGGGPDASLVESLLICRDQVVGAMSVRSCRLLLGVLEGRSQLELAESEQISASAVSQRVRRDGITALVAAEHLLEGV